MFYGVSCFVFRGVVVLLFERIMPISLLSFSFI